jgi:hypothetical protein
MLAAGDEPHFELFEIGHFHKCNNFLMSFPATVMATVLDSIKATLSQPQNA